MKVPTRILKLAEITTKETSRYSIDCIQFRRIDGKAVATATDGTMGIVASWSDGAEEEDDWQHLVKADTALLAYGEATRCGASEVTVQEISNSDGSSLSVIDVGAIETHSKSGDKKFPNMTGQSTSLWGVFSDPDTMSVKFDPLRLLRMLEVLVTAMGVSDDDDRMESSVVLTLSRDDEFPLVLTADVDDVKVAAALMPISGEDCLAVKPAWNPADLTKTEASDEKSDKKPAAVLPFIRGL